MTPKEQMIKFCKMTGADQAGVRKEIIKTLEKFFKTASLEDLDILNQKWHYDESGAKAITHHGLNLSIQILLLLGAYGKLFFNPELLEKKCEN